MTRALYPRCYSPRGFFLTLNQKDKGKACPPVEK